MATAFGSEPPPNPYRPEPEPEPVPPEVIEVEKRIAFEAANRVLAGLNRKAGL